MYSSVTVFRTIHKLSFQGEYNSERLSIFFQENPVLSKEDTGLKKTEAQDEKSKAKRDPLNDG